jgi:membrane-associated phospholipid phosphatase
VRAATQLGTGLALVLAGVAGGEPAASAQPAAISTPIPTPFDRLGEDIVDAFTGPSLIYHGGAVALTGVMAFAGLDHAVRVGVQENLVSPVYADAAYYAGYLVPAVSAPGLYVVGLLAQDPTTAGAGAAALQALGLTLATTGALKLAVGRVYPTNGADPNAPDHLSHPEWAHEFTPFRGLLAWPSGHASASFSVAGALSAYYSETWLVVLVSYPIAAAIGFGMVDGDRHWTSDVLAGALIGHAIGYSVGRNFRKRIRESRAAAVRLGPLSVAGGVGVGAAGDW